MIQFMREKLLLKKEIAYKINAKSTPITIRTCKQQPQLSNDGFTTTIGL